MGDRAASLAQIFKERLRFALSFNFHCSEREKERKEGGSGEGEGERHRGMEGEVTVLTVARTREPGSPPLLGSTRPFSGSQGE